MIEQVVINLGGEGEIPNAIDVNDLSFPRLSTQMIVARSHILLRADMRRLPFKSSVADLVVGRSMPFMAIDEWAGIIAGEAFRVLKTNGTVDFQSITAGSAGWLPYLENAGFELVQLYNGRALGVKP